MKSRNKTLLVLAIAMLISTMAIATASATSDVKNEKKTTGIAIESKEKKVSSYKVTWNYNGGKIGNKKSKVTTIKRGSKIGKLVATPKRSEYTFKGWYSKKTGGKKITKNTKVTKKVTFFAQWTKKSSSTTNSEIVGAWFNQNYNGVTGYYDWRWYTFKADGTFNYTRSDYRSSKIGKYKVSGGKITFTNIVWYDSNGKIEEEKYPNTVVEYKFVKFSNSDKYKYLSIPILDYPDETYLSSGWIFQSNTPYR